MTELTQRQSSILALVNAHGYVATERLVSEFGVTPQTIRRDINDLCSRKLLHRYHGGAGRPISTQNEPYLERKRFVSEGKRLIGSLVAEDIHDGASLFINIGTTTEAVARALLNHADLRIVTNNIHVADILSTNPTFEISIAGGVVRNRDGGVVGHAAAEFVSQFRLDFGVIGVSGIDIDGALLDFDSRETQIAKAIMANASKTLLVADQTKFGRRAMVKFGSFASIDALYTDAEPPEPFSGALRANDVEIRTALRSMTPRAAS